jgi:hypothetical protein
MNRIKKLISVFSIITLMTPGNLLWFRINCRADDWMLSILNWWILSAIRDLGLSSLCRGANDALCAAERCHNDRGT